MLQKKQEEQGQDFVFIELVPSLQRTIQAKKASKEARKDRGQDFVLVLSLQLSLRENTSKKASESEARKFPRI
jgi:hypothetical protein